MSESLSIESYAKLDGLKPKNCKVVLTCDVGKQFRAILTKAKKEKLDKLHDDLVKSLENKKTLQTTMTTAQLLAYEKQILDLKKTLNGKFDDYSKSSPILDTKLDCLVKNEKTKTSESGLITVINTKNESISVVVGGKTLKFTIDVICVDGGCDITSSVNLSDSKQKSTPTVAQKDTKSVPLFSATSPISSEMKPSGKSLFKGGAGKKSNNLNNMDDTTTDYGLCE